VISLQVNIKGIGTVTFPEGTTKEKIQSILKKSFSKKDENPFTLKEIEQMVKGFIKDEIKPAETKVPDVINKVDLKPTFEATMPKLDMKPIADAIKSMPEPKISITLENPNKVIEIEVTERDTRGFIKTLMCTEVVNG
jgi:hypothetical protein